jgi:hypothetical protein
MRCVHQARPGADLEGLVNPFQNALTRHLQGACDLADSFASMITPQDLRSLDIAESSGLGLAKLIEMILSSSVRTSLGRVDARAMAQHSTKQETMDMF